MVFREKFSKAKFRVRAEEPVTLFSLVGEEVMGRCSRNPVLSPKLPSSPQVGAFVPAEELGSCYIYPRRRKPDPALLMHYCFLTVPP